jgi:Ca2+-transporting ATPase
VLIGLVGIQDPMREEVPEAVRQCESAGVTVRMVTGDNIHTAIAIATKCGIYHPGGFDIAMTGLEFRKKVKHNKQKLLKVLPRLRVLARSSPQDKHVLVGLLQESGDVVAVTGDGTNDAPALKLSDVGFAMNSGTDIAKGASAMVLLNDNFATVVTAIRWGRAVNDNIKKFLQFQLAINIDGVLLTFIGALASPTSKEPLQPVQLLWLNMIMDTLAAVALSTELPDDECLQRAPVFKQAPLITRRMWVFIFFHAALQMIIMLLVLFLGHKWFETVEDPDRCTSPAAADLQHCRDKCEEVDGKLDGIYCQQGRIHSAMIFNIFIWLQFFNTVNARKIHGEMNPFEGIWTRSRNLVIIYIMIAGLQAVIVEFGGDTLSVVGLTGRQWGICIGFGAIELVAGVIQRFIPIKDAVPQQVTARQIANDRLRELYENPAASGHYDPEGPSLNVSFTNPTRNISFVGPSRTPSFGTTTQLRRNASSSVFAP